jgi:uncharacterized membrane protein YfcA
MLDSTWLQWLYERSLFDGDTQRLVLAVIGALCIGLSKSGLAGTATLTVVLMAQAFGAKESVGLVLPLLIAADVMGYLINRKAGSWAPVWRMAPPALAGVVLGWLLLDRIDNSLARPVIGWLIVGLLGFKLVLDARKEQFLRLTQHAGFAASMGFLAGVVTMLANAAGPVMTVYLLAQRLEKAVWLGTFSRYFLFMNLMKVPFSANLKIINEPSLVTNLILLPVVVIGVLLGWAILKRIPQQAFEWLLFALTLIAAGWMIVGS